VSIQREEAEQALRDAEAAADRSATAVGYQRSSQYLILWGVVWAVGNVAAFLRLPLGPYAFAVLMLIGVAGSFIIGMRAGRDGRRRSYALQSLVIGVAFVLFANGMQIIAHIQSLEVAEAVICLAIGAGYMVMGVSMGWRMTAVGLALMVSIIAGWIYAREQFFLWMALTGGGGLILGGLWMRRA
jgi:hypothetical protein